MLSVKPWDWQIWQTLFLLVVLILPGVLVAGETWTVGSTHYENVRIQEVTPATVRIFHSKGITQFDLADLPVELRERFGYKEDAALKWREEDVERIEREAAAARAEQEAWKRSNPRPAGRLSTSRADQKPTAPEEVVFHKEKDLRPLYREMGLFTKDQGRRPSCTIFALVSALEFEQGRLTGQAERLSEEFLIWATLQLHPGIPLDTAFNFAEVFAALQTYGVPTHAEMPNTFGKSMGEIEPSESVIESAADRRGAIPVWFRADDPHLIERLVGALNQEKPVVVAVRWPNWRTLNRTFLLSAQKPMEDAAHAVTLVGYRNPTGNPDATTFIFRNSYGIQWGNAGCGFIRAAYLKENLLGAFFMRL
ncbi:MAG: C1 family peptidase [Puniceicoccaceae bacterium]